MDFDSPDVMKDFPGLYASEMSKQCSNDSDYSDENDKVMKKDILIGKRKEKKDKERGYATLEGESSADETIKSRSPSKSKKAKSFKFTTKTKDKRDKSREKDKDGEKKKDRDKKYDKKIDKEKAKSEKVKKIKQSIDEQGDIGEMLPVFGANLKTAVERSPCHDGIDIPLPLRECVDYVEEAGAAFEGVYKISGTKSKVIHLRKMYNQRENIRLSDYDVPTVTSLFKTFLRDLPEPIFTNDLLIRFEEAGAILNANTREKHLKILIDNLPYHNKLLLGWLITHLNNISLNERYNKMSKQNLAAALNHTFHCSSRLLNFLLHHSPTLFSDVTIIKYVPPLESGAVLPEEPDQIEEELKKQESLLNQIHKEMNVGCISKQREELLWEVQRIITQLKRKLKNAMKDKEVVPEKPPDAVETVPEDPLKLPPVEAEPAPSLEIPDLVREDTSELPAVNNENAGIEEAIVENPCEKIEIVPKPANHDLTLEKTLALLHLKNNGLHQLRDSLMKHIEEERSEITLLKEQLSGESPCLVPVSEEKLDEVVSLFLKENQALQIKKVNLVRQIIEEHEMVIELTAQLISEM